MSGAVDGTRGRVDEAVVRQAIHWLVRLRSQPADDRLQRACAAWRAEHGEHERAWQQVSALNEELHGRFKALPGGVAYGTLDSSAQRLQRRQALKLLSLLVAGGAVAWVGRDSLPWQRLSADYSTATGERRSIELVDGTRLQLNTDSAVDVRYDAGQRLILLTSKIGRAHV